MRLRIVIPDVRLNRPPTHDGEILTAYLDPQSYMLQSLESNAGPVSLVELGDTDPALYDAVRREISNARDLLIMHGAGAFKPSTGCLVDGWCD